VGTLTVIVLLNYICSTLLFPCQPTNVNIVQPSTSSAEASEAYFKAMLLMQQEYFKRESEVQQMTIVKIQQKLRLAREKADRDEAYHTLRIIGEEEQQQRLRDGGQ
jgi:hypothetical protein